MQAIQNRTFWLAAALFLGPIGTTVSHAKEQEPVDLLKSQGLKRSSGATWILPGEAVILKDVKKGKASPCSCEATRNNSRHSRWATRIRRS